MSNRTAAVTSGPARQPLPASSAPAMKRRSNERSKANSLRPRGRLLERADALWRPVGEEGAADDPLLLDGSPDAAVIAVPTVVAHHKKVPGGNRDLLREVARVAVLRRVDVRLLLKRAVDVDAALHPLQAIAGNGHDALDEVRVRPRRGRRRTGLVGLLLRRAADVLVGAAWRLENDDVAAVRVAESRRHTVHQHPLADDQRRLHRLARDAERLYEEGLDAQREA